MTHEEQNGLVEVLTDERIIELAVAHSNYREGEKFEVFSHSRIIEFARALAALQAPQEAGGEPAAWRYKYNGQWYLSQSKSFALQGFDLEPLYTSHGQAEANARHWHGEIEAIGAMLGIGSPDAGEVPAAVQSLLAARPDETKTVHSDDLAVDSFAAAMKAKLLKKREEGRGGWDNPAECSIEYLSYLLVQHIWKGDPVDVGNLAMMIQQRGGRIVIDDETKAIAPSALSQPEAQAAFVERTPLRDSIAAVMFQKGTPDQQIEALAYAHGKLPASRPAEAQAVPEGWKPTHRHVKTGGEYTLLGIGRMQSEMWLEQKDGDIDRPSSFEPIDMREVAIYRGADGNLWVRPIEEFDDGRFASLAASPATGGA